MNTYWVKSKSVKVISIEKDDLCSLRVLVYFELYMQCLLLLDISPGVSQEFEQSDIDERRDDDVSAAKVNWKKLCSFVVEISALNVQPPVIFFDHFHVYKSKDGDSCTGFYLIL